MEAKDINMFFNMLVLNWVFLNMSLCFFFLFARFLTRIDDKKIKQFTKSGIFIIDLFFFIFYAIVLSIFSIYILRTNWVLLHDPTLRALAHTSFISYYIV